MAKNWLGLSAGLCILSALVGAHASPAKATRPLTQASGALDKLMLSTPRDLNQVTERRLLGLTLEDARTRETALRQARAYVMLRKNGPKTTQLDAYVAGCARPSERENPFCIVEKELAAARAESAAPRTPRDREKADAVVADLESGDLARLAAYSAQDVSRGISRFDEFWQLSPLARKLIELKTCSHGSLAQGLAAKAEEAFPEPVAIDLARKLYRRALDCGSQGDVANARFRYSMISIWQNKCDEAEPELLTLTLSPDAALLHARAKYWRHHCATVLGNDNLKTEMRESLWRDHTLTFHNLAINGSDPRLQSLIRNLTQPKIAVRSLIRPDINTYVRGTEALIAIGANDLASEFTDRFVSKLTSVEPEVRLYTAALMHRSGNALPKFRILTSLFQDAPRLINRASLTMLFPNWYQEFLLPKAKILDPLLVLSLIRQESAFNFRALSTAGARGLMQVMPATARHIARVRRDRLFDPRTNIEVGTKYFLHRLDQYKGDVELTLAAYNAGFTRVDRWVKRYPLDNKVLFMDFIPFRETREYVSSILRNYYWYTQLYGMDATGSDSVAGRAPAKVNAILSANAGAKSDAGSIVPASVSQ